MTSTKISSFSKIHIPDPGDILHRENLHSALDAARKHRVIWIHAPGGYGKTTFVSDYIRSRKIRSIWYQMDKRDNDIASFFYYMALAVKQAGIEIKLDKFRPEYILGLPTFAENFFRTIFKCKQNLSTLVFDNYQEVSDNLNYYEILYHAAKELPPGGDIIIISRHKPSHFFARMMANDEMILIDNTFFTLSYEEFLAIYKLRAGKKISDKALQSLYKQAHGWLAGAILLLENGGKRDIEDELDEESVFNYLGQEMFSKLDVKTRELLLYTAFLPYISEEMAISLTGNKKAGVILSNLSNDNYFTTRYSGGDSIVYQYHPLLRNFLSMQAEGELSDEHLYAIKHKSAKLLEQAGQIESATELWINNKEWPEVVRIIKSDTKRFIEQGRSMVVDEWASSLPQYLYSNDPWLNYWIGTLKLTYNPIQGREYFEKAYDLFNLGNDATGLFLSTAGMMNSYVLVWDNFNPLAEWITKAERLIDKYKEFPSKEIEESFTLSMFESSFNTKLYDPVVSMWQKRLVHLMDTSNNIDYKLKAGTTLLLYYIHIGDSDKSRSLLSEIQEVIDSYNTQNHLAQIILYYYEAYNAWINNDFEQCRFWVTKGLDIAERTGIHLFDSRFYAQLVYNDLLDDDIKKASQSLQKMEKCIVGGDTERANFQFLLSYLTYCEGDFHKALQYAEGVLNILQNSEFPFALGATHLRVAYAGLLAGEPMEKNLFHVDETIRICNNREETWMGLVALMNKSLILLRLGREEDKEKGRKILSKGIKIAKDTGFFPFEGWLKKDISFICEQALSNNIEPEYTKELIKKYKLLPI